MYAEATDPAPLVMAPESQDAAAGRFVVMHQALLNRDMAVNAYEFTHTSDVGEAEYEFERDRALLAHVRGEDARKLTGTRTAFVSIAGKLLFDRGIDALAGTTTVPLVRRGAQELNALQIHRIAVLARAGVPVALADGRTALANETLAKSVSVVFFSVTDFLPPDLLQIARRLSRQNPALGLGIRGLETQEEFDACKRMGFSYFHGPFIRRRGDWQENRVNPGALRICDLLSRVRKGATVEEIAEQIRLDPMISYRILRLANSAAVGASRTITSIRDAIVILGSDPLYRWLVLLLCVTAPATPGQQVLLEGALTRARLMELLAAPQVTTRARQTLFLTGLFSMLDLILQVPMATLLSQLPLPPEAIDAIAGRRGPCALPLQLAEACELSDDALVMELCVEMGLNPATFNDTMTTAAAWARESAQAIPA